MNRKRLALYCAHLGSELIDLSIGRAGLHSGLQRFMRRLRRRTERLGGRGFVREDRFRLLLLRAIQRQQRGEPLHAAFNHLLGCWRGTAAIRAARPLRIDSGYSSQCEYRGNESIFHAVCRQPPLC